MFAKQSFLFEEQLFEYSILRVLVCLKMSFSAFHQRNDILAGSLQSFQLHYLPLSTQQTLFHYLLASRVTLEKSGASLTFSFPLQVTYFCLGIGRILSLSLKFSNFIRIYLGLGVILYYIFLLHGKLFQSATQEYFLMLLICFHFYFSFLTECQFYDCLHFILFS